MSPRRFAASQGKLDSNSSAIVRALRRCGASVVDLHAVGGGVSDILCGYHGVNYLLEIKTAKGLVRESQTAFAEAWRGAAPVIVRSEIEALAAIGIRLDV